jgi:hypothetical protein
MKCKNILAGLILTILAGYSGYSYYFENNASYGQYPVIDGIKCDTSEHFNFHYHAHLDIVINGMSYVIPAGIGIHPPQCIYWLHTHDISGIIHVESPDNMKFNNTQLFEYKVGNDDKKLSVYVNGTLMDKQNRDIPIHNHDVIAIIYGSPPPEIPSTYEFQY